MPVFFDAETSGLFDDDDDTAEPPEIYCVCAYDSDTKTFKRFYEKTGGPMRPQQVKEAARYLVTCGKPVVGYNSTAYDLRLLGHHCADEATRIEIAELAFEHIDVLLCFWCRNGYPTSLQSLASGMQCGSKLMDGKDAIAAWKNGELQKVLAYCDADCCLLAHVYSYITTHGRFARVAKSGKLHTTVVENYQLEGALAALEKLEALDTSWMTAPLAPNVDWAFNFIGVP